ncbi:M20 family metallopeptidase [Alienimonas sp. DA493]|uniref:M20 metallopeptidase family protein n=1 Tax=Alienimonas sp. DA493 TaxID=3373605 RepID=UPI003754BAAB
MFLSPRRSSRFAPLLWVAGALGAVGSSLPAAEPAAAPADGPRDSPAAWADERLPALLDLYRHLHSRPELSNQETATAAKLAEEWRAAGYDVTTGVGGTGVVALLKNGAGPTVMFRCDLDALPVTEATGLPFASQVKTERPGGGETGVMHACGHDVHMTSVTGAGRYFAEHRDDWSGTVMLIAQPAEEIGAGAKAMLEDGLFERFPKPDYAVALHVTPNAAAGTVETLAGYSLANVDSVDVTFHGRGGHGAQPHTTQDPIVMAAEFVLSAQAIVAREVKPTDPAVVTVGSIHAGSKHNIIPDEATLQLTVRSYSDAVRKQLIAAIERRANAAAAAAGAEPPTVNASEGTPSLYNDPALTARLTAVFQNELGADAVGTGEPSMGGEDFSRYGKAGVPNPTTLPGPSRLRA